MNHIKRGLYEIKMNKKILFNPLKPYWVLYLIIVIIAGALIFFIPNIFSTLNIAQIVLTSLISIIISVTIFYFGIKENARLQYADGLKKVIEEMQKNHLRVLDFPRKIEENCVNWENADEWRWIGKESSYTNWGDGENFHLKYLPTSAYFNFVNKGYILSKKYLEAPTERIAHFYQFCILFNKELQIIENLLRILPNSQNLTAETDAINSDSVLQPITDEGNEIFIEFQGRIFRSKREFCNFLKCEWFQQYAYKNDLNEGLIGEYQSVIESLGPFLDHSIGRSPIHDDTDPSENPLTVQPRQTYLAGQSEPEKPILTFFKKSSDLFIALSIFGALIALLPSFLDIVIGKEWIHLLLSSEFGFYTLTLLLTTSYTSALFMFILLGMIAGVFYHEVWESQSSDEDKIVYSFLMAVGGVAVGSLILFLLCSWVTRIDYAIKFNILIISLIIGYSIIIGMLLILLNMVYKRYKSKIFVVVIFLLVVGFLLFFLTLPLIQTHTEVSNYYRDKNPFSISWDQQPLIYSNNTSLVLPLKYNLPKVPDNLTFFDVNYAQCHWSTNYGYFFTKNTKYSIVKRYDQEIIIPNCPYVDDQVFWTYDISDYSKYKPPVFIGFTLEDTNNPTKKLGSANLSLNWSETDTLEINNQSFQR